MKKALLIIVISMFLAAPALVLYYSMRTSAAAMQDEHEKQLLKRMQNELQRQDMLINPVIEIYRKLFMALRQTRSSVFFNDLFNEVNDELLSYATSLMKEATSLWSGGEAFIVYQKNGHDSHFTVTNGKKTPAGQLEKFGLALRVAQAFYNPAQPLNVDSQVLRNIARESLGVYFSFSILNSDGDGDKIQRVVLREHDSYRLLVMLRLRGAFLINYLIDLTRVDDDQRAKRKIANWQYNDMGLAFFKSKNPEKMFYSKYFNSRQAMLKTIRGLLEDSSDRSINLRYNNSLIMATAGDPKKQHRTLIVAEIPSEIKQPGMLFLVILFGFAGCYGFKIAIDSIVFGRGSGFSIKMFIVSIFVLVTMLPLLSSAYLANEYVVANFKKEKNRVVKELTDELLTLDQQTFATYRSTINLAKSLNSVEKLAEITGLPESASIRELFLKTAQQLYRNSDQARVSDIWVYEEGQEFFSVKFDRDKRIYSINKSANMMLEEFFLSKKKEYLRRHNPEKKPETEVKQGDTIEIESLKTELLDSFFLNLFGEKTYYMMREDFGSLLKQESFMDTNAMITIPVTRGGKTRYICTWIFDSASIRDHFPENRLRQDPDQPLFTMYGNDQYIGARPIPLADLSDKFPALVALGNQSLITGSRLFMQDYLASGSPIFEARPARYSDFIICGSRQTRALESISDELVAEALKYFAVIAGAGIFLALLTSLYFTLPIRQLIQATSQIAEGNYETRLDPRHPDEFALAAATFNKMATGLQQGELLSSFVSESVKELTAREQLTSSDIAQNTRATVLFSSIRDFHSVQQQHDPQKTFEILQAHLSAAVEAVEKYGGEIDKMIEDKVMIVFDSRRQNEQEQVNAAVATAISIKQAMQKVYGLHTAAGITTGEVVSGVMGASNVRLSKTVVGDTVNLAARLAAIAAGFSEGGIVAAESSVEKLSGDYRCEKLPISQVKGKTHTVEAFGISQVKT